MSTQPRSAKWPWVAFAVFLSLAAIGCVFVAINRESIAEQVPFIIAFSVFGAVGALVLSRSPRNRIGALLLFGSFATAASFVAGELTTYLVRRDVSEGPVVATLALLSDVGWLVGILPVLFFLPALFPDGHLLSRRWLPLAWGYVGALAFLFVAIVFATPTLTGSIESVTIRNPLYVSAFDAIEIPDVLITPVLVLLLLGSPVSLIVRFRRSTGVERQQIKWVALAAVLLVASFVVSSVLLALGASTLVESIVSGLAFLALPVAVGIAVLQYRLYDLDVVVKKTLVAGVLVLVVIAVYAGVVGLFGLLASEQESAGWLFVIALLLGLAFRPVARFGRRLADRIVYGRRATPYEVLTEFSERVGDAYATEDVLGRMAQILGQGAGAAVARVWLRVSGQLRPVASWPTDATPADAVRATEDRLPELAGETAVEVRDRGELLGALTVSMPANDPMNPAKERLVHDLASHAGLVLRNVRLVEELRASQRRIVAAQDVERRRLERNIHDGAQQQLVALTVKMRLAQSLAKRDGEQTASMLEQMQREAQTALDDLRDLARGVYPPLLADEGLRAALDAQVRRSPVPVELLPDGVTRYEPEIEAAVYFSVLETLQNVAKYAEATRVIVRLGDDDGRLAFAVEDDGRGFDPSEVRSGSGLQGIADRLSSLGGSVEIRSRPGAGTVVSGHVPIATTPTVSPLEPERTVVHAEVGSGRGE